MWMRRAKVSGELVQRVVSDKYTGWDAQHTVLSTEVLNGGAATASVAFAEDLLRLRYRSSTIRSSIVPFLVREYLGGSPRLTRIKHQNKGRR